MTHIIGMNRSKTKIAELEWHNGVPFAPEFADYYFKPQNGWHESIYNFVEGNQLPQRWQDGAFKQFTIAEMGFGTGLNLLAAWAHWQQYAPAHAHLDFVSAELYPLAHIDLARALQPFRGQAGPLIDRLLEVYPTATPGWHRRWLAPNVTLTLLCGDAATEFAQLQAQVDAWFLDGFAPARNPAMWQPALFTAMANLSHAGTSLASFTAAKYVREDLAKAGFAVQKRPGFAYKKDAIHGHYAGGTKNFMPIKAIHILGAGLAAAGAAQACARRGIAVSCSHDVQQPSASTNQFGLVNPKLHAVHNAQTQFGTACYSFARHVLADAGLWRPTGSLFLPQNETEQKRYHGMAQNLGWPANELQWLDNHNIVADVADMALPPHNTQALWAPGAGQNQPTEIVKHGLQYAAHQPAANDELVVNATGLGLLQTGLPLQAVRGQVSYGTLPQAPKCNLMFGRYIMPLADGTCSFGATFQRGRSDAQPQGEDNTENRQAVANMLQLQPACVQVQAAWAGVRVAARDYWPIAGMYGQQYLLGALGSHGIQYALLLGELLAAQITGAPWPLPKNIVEKHLLPTRFESAITP